MTTRLELPRRTIAVLTLAIALLWTSPSAASVDYEWLLTGPTTGQGWSPPTPTTATATGTFTNYSAANVVNNSGMSGWGYPQDRHDTTSGNNSMWLSPAYATNDNSFKYFQIDLGSTQALGKMLIWNFNRFEQGGVSYSGRGVRHCYIGYSNDGVNFSWLDGGHGYGGLFELAKAGNSFVPGAATNRSTGPNAPVDFKGRPARYVRIWLISNWGGHILDQFVHFGLSEVRIYRHASQVEEAGDFIAAKTLDRSSPSGSTDDATTNHYGMSDAGTGTYATTATINTASGWSSAANDSDPFLLYDLGGTYPLDKMAVWNFNVYFYLPLWGRGIKNATIYYSRQNHGYNPDDPYGAFLGWTKLEGPNADDTWTFAHATSTNGQGYTSLIEFPEVSARYVMIVPNAGLNNGNWGGAYGDTVPHYALSQVRFYAGAGTVAEPAPRWTGIFGQRSATTDVWSGADQGYSIPYVGPGQQQRSLFTFSDTFRGKWTPTTYALNGALGFLHNSLADWTGGATLTPATSGMTFNADATGAEIRGVSGSYFYWLFGGVYLTAAQHQQSSVPKIFMLASKHYQSDNVQVGTSIASLSLDGSNNIVWSTGSPLDSAFFDHEDLSATQYIEYSYGVDVFLAADGYLYIYGRLSDFDEERPFFQGVHYPIVARCLPNQIQNYSSWRFYAGSGTWVTDFTQSEPITPLATVGMNAQVRPAFDASHAGQYMMTEKSFGVGGLQVSYANDPWGPFEDWTVVYEPPERNEDWFGSEAWTYAGIYHPELSMSGEGLFSYSINCDFGSSLCLDNLDLYHPRFVRVREIP